MSRTGVYDEEYGFIPDDDCTPCRGCEDYDAPDGCKSHGGCARPQTNADRIRAMTDEELARFITGEDFCELLCNNSPSFCDGDCEKRMLDWLKQEVDNG